MALQNAFGVTIPCRCCHGIKDTRTIWHFGRHFTGCVECFPPDMLCSAPGVHDTHKATLDHAQYLATLNPVTVVDWDGNVFAIETDKCQLSPVKPSAFDHMVVEKQRETKLLEILKSMHPVTMVAVLRVMQFLGLFDSKSNPCRSWLPPGMRLPRMAFVHCHQHPSPDPLVSWASTSLPPGCGLVGVVQVRYRKSD
jgi:hypothetical protein